MEILKNNIEDKHKKQWFVMSAYKQEALAEKILSTVGNMEFFIAKHYIVKMFHGVKRKMLVPYIPSIIFVRASQMELLEFKKNYNFIKFVLCHHRTGVEYLIVPDNQMNDFIKVATSECDSVKYFSPSELNIAKGTKVKVIGGQFDGVEGMFVKVKGCRSRQVVVIIPDLMAISVEINPDLIEVKENPKKEKTAKARVKNSCL